MACESCGKDLHVGEWPFCPHGFGANTVIGDEIDVWIKHGLCNPDGTPCHYTSRAEMNQEAKRRGMVNMVRHTDQDHHVKRWI